MGDARIGILGCGGRMGRQLLAGVLDTPGARLAGGSERPDSAAVGQDLGVLAGRDALGLSAIEDPAALFAASDLVIDFTLPTATALHAALAAEHRTALVVGTTGLLEEQLAELERAAQEVAVLRAANMSLGVNLLIELVTQAAAKLDEAYDIEIVEMHHRHKVDAPSGTALELGEAAAAGRNVDLDDSGVRVRDGHTGPRRAGTIGFATLRGGDVAGDHTVIFATEGERLELGHRASSRQVFVQGALKAALWLRGKPAGLYSMRDVLGL
ncbi:4-hydroxy-tetrahydrodipicolinate reductase [Algihabitans albus]|uniref:4-hydroxy-tetrahydrodipicolinate reductase n=1 Tax=Algihabitans albus TaxID=2164067 RepID=UPI000E5D73CE|nr:4-hydroxy-tetrahydrodipicolinate reductase [Algihabitans albus]